MPSTQDTKSQFDQQSTYTGSQDIESQFDQRSTYAGTDLQSASAYGRRKRRVTTAKDQDYEKIKKENDTLRIALQATQNALKVAQERDELRKENERLQSQLNSR